MRREEKGRKRGALVKSGGKRRGGEKGWNLGRSTTGLRWGEAWGGLVGRGARGWGCPAGVSLKIRQLSPRKSACLTRHGRRPPFRNIFTRKKAKLILETCPASLNLVQKSRINISRYIFVPCP
jgi:hypothetical protein